MALCSTAPHGLSLTMSATITDAAEAAAQRVRHRAFPQPVEVLLVPGALITIKTVCAVTGDSESTVRRAIKANTFPKPIKRGTSSRFVADEVLAWLRAQQVRA
jgi:excisionase family DNA binding protein